MAKERIVVAAGAALLVAGLILVIAVLPAEYGVDPLGIGRRLGLTAMSDVQKGLDAFEATRAATAGGAPTVAPQERVYQHETVAFKIEPGGVHRIQVPPRQRRGAALFVEGHEPRQLRAPRRAGRRAAGLRRELREKECAWTRASGTLTAPFSGIHGWYWENPGSAEVTVTLSAAGFYNMSHEFRKDQPPTTKMFQ